MEFCTSFETELGIGLVVASKTGLTELRLPGFDAGFTGTADKKGSLLTEQAVLMLKSYFRGVPQPFEQLPVDLSVIPTFRARILQLIRQIPHGTTRSYGEIAIMAGVPGAARAIGGAMAANPLPIIIPCHRIVASNGKLTGFTAPGGLSVKKFLLNLEAIEFKGELSVKKTAVINKTNLVSNCCK